MEKEEKGKEGTKEKGKPHFYLWSIEKKKQKRRKNAYLTLLGIVSTFPSIHHNLFLNKMFI